MAKGKNTLSAGLLNAAKPFRQRLHRAVRIIFEVKRTEVVKRTPKDIGTLRNTIFVDGPEQQGNKTICSIVAGGPAAPYAIVQHEDMSFKHEEGQAKYIESVIMESRATIGSDIAAEMKR